MQGDEVPDISNPPSPTAPPPATVDFWDVVIGQRLGGGTYGTCYEAKARNPKNGAESQELEDMVMKENNDIKDGEKQIKAEIENLAQLEDPHIVKFIAQVVGNIQPNRTAFLMERLHLGNVRKAFYVDVNDSSSGFLAQRPIEGGCAINRRRLCHQLILAVDYLHRKAMVHGDISWNNVLLGGREEQPIAKLCDFGTAFKVANGHRFITGTPLFCSQEVARKIECTQASDVYSLACVCFFLIFNQAPNYNSNDGSVFVAHYGMVGGARVGMRPICAARTLDWHQADPLQRLLIQAMDSNPGDRPTIETMVQQLPPFV